MRRLALLAPCILASARRSSAATCLPPPTLGAARVFTTADPYAVFTIDSSRNRLFFNANFSDARLAYLTSEIGGGPVRVGGSGGDLLSFATLDGNTACGPLPARYECLNASTLDAWVEARGLGARPIDVLAIDTEGLDAPVLAGGGALLARGGVRLLVFEYHNFRAWRETELRSVVAALDAHGYDCFLLQKKLALRLTGCWAPEFEFRAWSNVMCAYRAEEALLAALASFAVVPEVPGGGARAR